MFRAGYFAGLATFPAPRLQPVEGSWSVGPRSMTFQPGKQAPLDVDAAALAAYTAWVKAGRP